MFAFTTMHVCKVKVCSPVITYFKPYLCWEVCCIGPHGTSDSLIRLQSLLSPARAASTALYLFSSRPFSTCAVVIYLSKSSSLASTFILLSHFATPHFFFHICPLSIFSSFSLLLHHNIFLPLLPSFIFLSIFLTCLSTSTLLSLVHLPPSFSSIFIHHTYMSYLYYYTHPFTCILLVSLPVFSSSTWHHHLSYSSLFHSYLNVVITCPSAFITLIYISTSHLPACLPVSFIIHLSTPVTSTCVHLSGPSIFTLINYLPFYLHNPHVRCYIFFYLSYLSCYLSYCHLDFYTWPLSEYLPVSTYVSAFFSFLPLHHNTLRTLSSKTLLPAATCLSTCVFVYLS